jgi:lysophospholipase L1-like esterase
VAVVTANLAGRWLRITQAVSPRFEFPATIVAHLLHSAICSRCGSVVVHYCGSNDIGYAYDSWVSYEKVAQNAIDNTRAYVQQLEELWPDVRVLLIGIIAGPKRHEEGNTGYIKAINAGYHKLCLERTTTRRFFDLNPTLSENLDPGDILGQPLRDLYLPDGVHYHPQAYEIFREQLKPAIEQLREESTGLREESTGFREESTGLRVASEGRRPLGGSRHEVPPGL